MSDISRLMPASPPLSHCFAAALRTAIVRRLVAALLPMPALASSSARSSMMKRTAASRRGHGWASFQNLTTALVHLYFAVTCR